MDWARILAFVTGMVDQGSARRKDDSGNRGRPVWCEGSGLNVAFRRRELLARNEYLAAENRILKAQLKGRLKLSDAERAMLAEDRPSIGPQGSGRGGQRGAAIASKDGGIVRPGALAVFRFGSQNDVEWRARP